MIPLGFYFREFTQRLAVGAALCGWLGFWAVADFCEWICRRLCRRH